VHAADEAAADAAVRAFIEAVSIGDAAVDQEEVGEFIPAIGGLVREESMLADRVARAHGGRVTLPVVAQGFAVVMNLGPSGAA
jgi:hypothetical protein